MLLMLFRLVREGVLDGSESLRTIFEGLPNIPLIFDSLSYMEIRLILGKLLWHNDVAMAGENKIWDPQHEYENMLVYTNWIKPPLYLKLTPRKQ